MSKKKTYFPNNWKAIHDCPPEYFDSLTFDEFMDWKICGYEIPSSISCIIREKNLDTGRVREYVYSKSSAARDKARQIMDEGVSEIVVATEDSVHHLFPQHKHITEDYDDPLA